MSETEQAARTAHVVRPAAAPRKADHAQDRPPDRRLPGEAAGLTTFVLLAGVGGYVDAMSYLGLGRVLTAAMTGNTVLLALAVALADWTAVGRSGVALVGFVVGVAVAQVVIGQVSTARRWPRVVVAGLALELVPLVVLAVGWQIAGPAPTGVVLQALIAASAVGMGVQSAAARYAGVAMVATTYVTGTLMSLTSGTVDWIRAPRSAPDAPTCRVHGVNPAEAGKRQASTGEAPTYGPALPALVWCTYAVGAIAGGAIVSNWRAAAPILPTVVVAMLTVIELAVQRRLTRSHQQTFGLRREEQD